MKKIVLAVMSIAALGCAANALAEDTGWYIAGGIGGTDVTPLIFDTQNAMIASGNTRFVYSANQGVGASRLQAGYQIAPLLAVEGGLVNLGDYKYTASGGNLAAPVAVSTTLKAAYAAVVGTLPITERFSLFAKLGAAHVKASTVTGLPLGFAGTSVWGGTTGIGIKYEFSNGVSIQYEGDTYTIHASNPLNVGTINLGYKF